MTKIYFGTNRRQNRNTPPIGFGPKFSDYGLAYLRFGMAEVFGEKLDKYKIHVAHENITHNHIGKSANDGKTILGSKYLFQKVRQNMIDYARDTIVFIHGYNVTFHEALTSAARLKHNFSKENGGPEVNIVLFSWPSDGSMKPYLAYASDRRDAMASAPAFARGLLKLVDFLQGQSPMDSCNQKIHLIAHSMGNYVLRHTIQQYIAQSPGRPARLFDEIFLMAADEDDDTFEYDFKLKPLPSLAKRVNVYFNNNDRAMSISDMTKGNCDRLGDDGPRVPRGLPGKVSLIDCTPVVDGLIEHSYFLNSTNVVSDMRKVIVSTPSDQIEGRQFVHEKNCYRLVRHDSDQET